ncbi:MAG: sulfurtransferase TusA family protein [Candidatus Desantisbacteria bacterium]
MRLARFELFYSPLCPTCPAAKEVVREVAEEEGIELEEINIMSPEGENRAKKYEIRGIPHLVINGACHILGIPTKEAIAGLLREAQKPKEIKPDRFINIKGEVCPYTYVKSKLALEEIEPGEVLEIILDHKPAVENVPRSMENEGHKVLEVTQINATDYQILVKKK